MQRLTSPDALEKLRAELAGKRQAIKKTVFVCCGPGCLANGSRKIADAIGLQMEKQKVDASVGYRRCTTGCHGFCEQGPLVIVQPGDIFYCKVKPSDAATIVERTVKGDELVERLLYLDPGTKQRCKAFTEIPFYAKQTRVALARIGTLDPTDLGNAIASGGYASLAKALFTMKPDQVIDLVDRSGLRGKGGGGFLTGRKWRSCVKAPGDRRYVICNGDEGDPGAFMDRATMEGDPHCVIEGMIIGAYAVGSHEGYVYVREEYPLAVEYMQLGVDEARKAGLLGDNILGSDFSFDIKISRGGGAFVCGESSALMRSVEGKVGEPRAKYIHSVERGLWDQPTVLNNVETWATVPVIVQKGVDWFRSMGTKGSPGTKAFSLSGQVRNTGLIEVPMGVTLREVIFGIGGGLFKRRTFKAVQTGGPSGGCLPEDKLDLAVDFDELTRAGSMMGSGGMIVMDDRACMVDVARYFTAFLVDESCGKCVPCREGTKQLLALLTDITHGNATEDHLARIEALAATIMQASLCALGKSAPNPVLSTLKQFRQEYLSHIEKKRCPAGVCKPLTRFVIDEETCTGCGLCLKACPVDAIRGEKKKPHTIEPSKCITCAACREVCPVDAVEVAS
ncbi:MAG: 4Fe-4S binding protein [Candidatus Riflebacteria bacterium]|nr:4Fe-4S binding protein [Candidatus Riflebacteria bacterium]